MTDIYIFGFGLFVTVMVGSGLVGMIVANNRVIAAERRLLETPPTGRPPV
jgi:hypothetical protein